MMILKNLLLSFIIILSISLSCSNNEAQIISSPDNNIKVFVTNRCGRLFYSVNYIDQPIISPSKLGLEFKNLPSFAENLTITSVEKGSYDSTWQQVWGENKYVRNHYNQFILNCSIKESKNQSLKIIFRVFNDGLGIRYQTRGINDSVFITNELTEFNFAENFTSWSIPANFESYEMLYSCKCIDSVKSANTPITLQTKNGTCLSIHEANLTNYAGMTLKRINDKSRAFECDLVPWPDGIKVKRKGDFVSPWRTIQIAKNAASLIESNLILNLNEPCKLEETSWIKPMKYIGIWWGMHLGTHTWTLGERHGATNKEAIKLIDFAAEHNIGGVLVEGWNTGWENWGKAKAFDQTTPYSDFDINTITTYATSKKIDFIGHHETGGDAQYYEERIPEAFNIYQQLGVHNLKTGYAGPIQPHGQYHHGQYMVNHYRKVVELAAKHQITINAHEPIKPTGIRRTYPNMMSREGVRGMEWNGWSDGNPPNHHVILPFTRILAGPVDYTPGVFDILYKKAGKRTKWNDQDKGTSRVNTTLSKQLALYVVFYSPLQMASDLVKNYENHPAFKFIEDVPVHWEQTKVLNASIGEYVTIVRKDIASNDWYLGGITNEDARELEVNLEFLANEKKYIAEIYSDTEISDWKTNPDDYSIVKTEVNSASQLILKLAAGGGTAIRFRCVN